jgi:MFS family permease
MDNLTENSDTIDPNIPSIEIHKDINKNKMSVSFKQTFAAFKYPNYRLWFWGQLISLFGSWMQSTALAFFVYEMTKSPAFLGYTGFASGIPAWLFSFYGGVTADRFPRRNILILTQLGMMILAFLLAAMTFTEIVRPWHILVLAFFNGIAVVFDAPTRHAFVNELVEKQDLVNAIALNSTMFNTATAAGPALGGILYALFGPAWCFTINGISFMAVIYNLYRMNLKPRLIPKATKSAFEEIKEAILYLKSQKIIVALLTITTTLSAIGMGLVTLFPDWAVNILHGDSTTNGFLQSARGLGAVIFALIIATINRYIVRGKYLMLSTATLPILLFIFSFNRSIIVSLILLLLAGGVIITQFNLANGLIQTMVEDKFRGRVLSFYTFSFFALYPVGSLWIGSLAEHFGSPAAIMVNSIILFIIFVVIKIYFSKLSKIK